MDNYRMIMSAKEVVSGRGEDVTELTARDKMSKVEYYSGREEYASGFRDYHGPKGDELPNN